jgi:hypothetical protein
MFQGDKPDLLMYHGYEGGTVCADGCACRWILRQKWPDVPTHVGIYGQAPPDVTGMRVLIADFSYPEDELRAMAEQAREVIVLDHHESSRADDGQAAGRGRDPRRSTISPAPARP